MNKISEAVKTMTGREQKIIDVGRNDLPEFFKEMGFKVGVEIGVAKGEFTKRFCQLGLKMHAVDPWQTYPGYDHDGLQERLDAEYLEAQDRLKKYDCNIIRATSIEASKQFEDESIDFVYIDGHHEFKFIAEDIWFWEKKVKKGGVVSGHDFVHSVIKKGPYVCHVKDVVRSYTSAYNIETWFVLGRDHFPEDKKEKRDRWRSWMWIKK